MKNQIKTKITRREFLKKGLMIFGALIAGTWLGNLMPLWRKNPVARAGLSKRPARHYKTLAG